MKKGNVTLAALSLSLLKITNQTFKITPNADEFELVSKKRPQKLSRLLQILSKSTSVEILPLS